jgi:hypothetical protein
MISNIPFLHPETWKGTGMPLNMTEKPKVRGNVQVNPKRMKASSQERKGDINK